MPTQNAVNSSNFGLLPEPTSRFGTFTVSIVTNGAIALILVAVTMMQVHKIKAQKYEQTQLTFVTEPPKITPLPKIKAPKLPPPPKVEVARVEPPKIALPKPVEAPKPVPVPEMKHEAPVPAVAAPAPKAVTLSPQPKAVNLFAAAPAVKETPKASTQAVHFGDMNGVTPNPNASKPATVAAVGNPFGGQSGAAAQPQGKVGSTGFGNGQAVGSSAGSTGKVASAGVLGGSGSTIGGTVSAGKVASAGFSQKAATATPAMAQHAGTASTSVEITSKPNPQYTSEARAANIQGDVVLRVIFHANGTIEVLDVVRGLGHGLDEQAKRAASMIHFKPATSDGHAVDTTANIRISFQMA